MDRFQNDFEFTLGKHEDQRIIIAYAYAPLGKNSKDSQGEYVSDVRDLEEGVHAWMASGATLKLNHENTISPWGAQVVEAHVQHESTTINGKQIPRGAFILKIKVNDESLWRQIKDDRKYRAVSIGGRSARDADGRLTHLSISEVSLVERGAFRGENIIALKSETAVSKAEAEATVKEIVSLIAEVRSMLETPKPIDTRTWAERELDEDRLDRKLDKGRAYVRIEEERKHYERLNLRFMPTL